MWRLTERMVRSTLVTAWRLATSPTRTSPDLANATTDGVVRAPSAFAMTVGSPPSRTETTLFVVPRSMPTARAMVLPPGCFGCSWWVRGTRNSDSSGHPAPLSTILANKLSRCNSTLLMGLNAGRRAGVPGAGGFSRPAAPLVTLRYPLPYPQWVSTGNGALQGRAAADHPTTYAGHGIVGRGICWALYDRSHDHPQRPDDHPPARLRRVPGPAGRDGRDRGQRPRGGLPPHRHRADVPERAGRRRGDRRLRASPATSSTSPPSSTTASTGPTTPGAPSTSR